MALEFGPMTQRYCLFFLLICSLLANTDCSHWRSRSTDKPDWKGPDQPVYVVTPNRYAEEPDAEGPRFGDLIAIEIFDPKPDENRTEPSSASAYPVGDRIALFFGGQRQGNVRINRVTPFQCNSWAALVSTDPFFHLPTNALALASNARNIRPHTNRQREADATEREYAKKLAMNEFSKHGVPATLANIEFGDPFRDSSDAAPTPDRLVVTKLDGSDATFLIGTAFIRVKKSPAPKDPEEAPDDAIPNVFFIGKITKSGVTSESASYNEPIDMEDDEYDRFADQLDLDGDGTDEIVVERDLYEGESFSILHRQNGKWSWVHSGGIAGPSTGSCDKPY